MNGRERLLVVALERDLRRSTVLSYERLLRGIGALDADVTKEEALDRLYGLDNPNTRRATVIALRAVYGWKLKIPKAVPRRYDLPDEDTLRLALMHTPHEVRGLLMMYAGLRIGEACAVTPSQLDGDRLTIDRQVQQLHQTGKETTLRISPVKASVASVVIPWWLCPLVNSLPSDGPLCKPDGVRESFRRAGNKVGIKLNPHMLRHWYATTLIAKGVALPVVSQQMRHSDISVTLRTYVQTDAGASIHDLFG